MSLRLEMFLQSEGCSPNADFVCVAVDIHMDVELHMLQALNGLFALLSCLAIGPALCVIPADVF